MAHEDDKALRFNNGKPRMSLVPSSLNRYCAYGLSYGEQKYAAHNWRKGFNWTSLIDSLERHLADFKEGIDMDEESGLPQLCLIACNVAFLIEHADRGLGTDDRYIQPDGPSKVVITFKPPPPKN